MKIIIGVNRDYEKKLFVDNKIKENSVIQKFRITDEDEKREKSSYGKRRKKISESPQSDKDYT